MNFINGEKPGLDATPVSIHRYTSGLEVDQAELLQPWRRARMKRPRRSRGEFVRDLKTGLATGMVFALICAAFATLRFVLGGAAAFVAKTQLQYSQVMLLYLIGRVAGGLLIGVLRPLRRRSWGSFLIGVCAVIPISAMAALLVFERNDWYPWAVISIATSSLAAGGLGAALFGETKGWST